MFEKEKMDNGEFVEMEIFEKKKKKKENRVGSILVLE